MYTHDRSHFVLPFDWQKISETGAPLAELERGWGLQAGSLGGTWVASKRMLDRAREDSMQGRLVSTLPVAYSTTAQPSNTKLWKCIQPDFGPTKHRNS
jgi:hypothetical protein